MKELILNVLEDISGGQVNFESEAAREMVATTITAALKTKGSYKEYTEYELDEQKAREYWVCGVCGKSTFEVEEDYLVHPRLHLGCALKEEAKGNDYVYSGDMKKPYINDNVDETDKDKKLDWFEHSWANDDKRVTSDRRKENRREKNWINKLSEEIVSDKDTGYIYESPDGGKTVYRRKFGEDKRELVEDWEKVKNNE